jgi:hypothetical protein
MKTFAQENVDFSLRFKKGKKCKQYANQRDKGHLREKIAGHEILADFRGSVRETIFWT